MSGLNRLITRYLGRFRSFPYENYVRLQPHERRLENFSLPNVQCSRCARTTIVCQRETKNSPDSKPMIKEKKSTDAKSNTTETTIPLIVKLLSENQEKYTSPNRKDMEVPQSIEQLQQTLEDIKWDAEASIQRNNVEEIDVEEESFEHESQHESKMGLAEMSAIEDIFLDDNVPHVRMTQRRNSKNKQKITGTPDPSIPASSVPCSGCGASLHCQDPSIPGYMPSEKFRCLTRKEMRTSMCQRCFLIQAYNMFLNVRVSADTYPKILQEIKDTKALVIVVVDLFDMKNSVFSNLLEHIGRHRPLFIVGNKVDVIPKDSKGYLTRIKQTLIDSCIAAGLNPTGKNIRHVCLVSAKTGYGIESLVTTLMKSWQLKGNVYVVGSTNAGKSTLFNALLESDYCKTVARGFINRATVSVWPGTTLNLLEFPIMNPAPWRLLLRTKRLKMDQMEFADAEKDRQSRLAKLGSYKANVLTGHVGLTDFRSAHKIRADEAQAEQFTSGQEIVSFSHNKDEQIEEVSGLHRVGKGPQENDYKPESFTMYWCKDTPGVVNPEQIINLLEPEELVKMLPRSHIEPQCVLIKPGQVLFVTGLGRIDYVEGRKSIYLTTHVAYNVKLHVKDKEEADEFYMNNLGKTSLVVPLGDDERLSKIPSLVGKAFHIVGTDWETASADVQLSSLGWVSVAAGRDMPVTLRAYTPGGVGLNLRLPALLPNFTVFRGKRKGKTPFHHPRQLKK